MPRVRSNHTSGIAPVNRDFSQMFGCDDVAQALLPAASALMPTLWLRHFATTAKACRDESRHGRHECPRHIGWWSVRYAG